MGARALVAVGLGAALLACDASHPDDSDVVDRLDCEDCHAAEYDTATVHAERGYSRECWGCHGTSDWDEAVTEHDDFSIRREPHAGYDCSACHLDREDRDDISCIGCHAHTEERSWVWHVGMDEYEWSARSCYRCHGDDD